MSWRPAWFTKQVIGQLGFYRETLWSKSVDGVEFCRSLFASPACDQQKSDFDRLYGHHWLPMCPCLWIQPLLLLGGHSLAKSAALPQPVASSMLHKSPWLPA